MTPNASQDQLRASWRRSPRRLQLLREVTRLGLSSSGGPRCIKFTPTNHHEQMVIKKKPHRNNHADAADYLRGCLPLFASLSSLSSWLPSSSPLVCSWCAISRVVRAAQQLTHVKMAASVSQAVVFAPACVQMAIPDLAVQFLAMPAVSPLKSMIRTPPWAASFLACLSTRSKTTASLLML